MKYDFTIIIPVFNEKENLERLKKELLEYLNKVKLKTSILLIDDGSTDGSGKIIKEICEEHKHFYYIQFAHNMGLSTALKAGFETITSPIIGYMDADLQTTPFDFDKLLPYIKDYSLVMGIRTNRKDGFIKKISSKIAYYIRNLATKDKIKDTGCPLKIIKKSCADKLFAFKGMHRFLPALVMLNNGKVKQVPVQHFKRKAGKSKFHLHNRLLGPFLDTLAFIWLKNRKIKYKIISTNLKNDK